MVWRWTQPGPAPLTVLLALRQLVVPQEWWCPLHHAESAEVVRMLVDAGAQVNSRTKTGETPLIQATTCNRLPVVKALLRAQADADLAYGPMGLTALDVAKMNNFTEIVEELQQFATESKGFNKKMSQLLTLSARSLAKQPKPKPKPKPTPTPETVQSEQPPVRSVQPRPPALPQGRFKVVQDAGAAEIAATAARSAPALRGPRAPQPVVGPRSFPILPSARKVSSPSLRDSRHGSESSGSYSPPTRQQSSSLSSAPRDLDASSSSQVSGFIGSSSSKVSGDIDLTVKPTAGRSSLLELGGSSGHLSLARCRLPSFQPSKSLDSVLTLAALSDKPDLYDSCTNFEVNSMSSCDAEP